MPCCGGAGSASVFFSGMVASCHYRLCFSTTIPAHFQPDSDALAADARWYRVDACVLARGTGAARDADQLCAAAGDCEEVGLAPLLERAVEDAFGERGDKRAGCAAAAVELPEACAVLDQLGDIKALALCRRYHQRVDGVGCDLLLREGLPGILAGAQHGKLDDKEHDEGDKHDDDHKAHDLELPFMSRFQWSAPRNGSSSGQAQGGKRVWVL